MFLSNRERRKDLSVGRLCISARLVIEYTLSRFDSPQRKPQYRGGQSRLMNGPTSVWTNQRINVSLHFDCCRVQTFWPFTDFPPNVLSLNFVFFIVLFAYSCVGRKIRRFIACEQVQYFSCKFKIIRLSLVCLLRAKQL